MNTNASRSTVIEAPPISIAAICGYVLRRYPAVALVRQGEEIGLFYNPYNRFPDGIHLLSFTQAGDSEPYSTSTSQGIAYRMNLALPADSFRQRFGNGAAPAADGPEIDALAPHPVRGVEGWVTVVNPSAETFEELKPLIDEAYGRSASRFAERLRGERV